jgi:hypothetical protein
MFKDILSRIELARVSDSPLNLIKLIKDSSLEIQTLRALAEDMYIVLSNEIGDNSVTKAYQAYIERHQND